VPKGLPFGGSYAIIDEVYGDEVRVGDAVYKETDLSNDQQRRKAVKSRRHKLRKRLVEPYRNSPSGAANPRPSKPGNAKSEAK
jgi:hypothetical protein